MDRMIYLAMSGATALMQRQDALSNNLANANTTGFRSDLMAFRAVPQEAAGTAGTRVFALEATAGFSPTQGPVTHTGRSLDVAIQGPGWFVVQAPDGSEEYTRDGSFTLDADGTLQTASGLPVLGDGGPLAIPQNADVTVGEDGTVTARVANQPPVQVGRLRLANPEAGQLVKGPDGLMRSAAGDPIPDDPSVKVVGGALEGSNVNVVESMVGMIQLARQFDMQMKLLQTAENDDQRATQLLSTKS